MQTLVNTYSENSFSKALDAFDLKNHDGLLFTNELTNKETSISPQEWFELEKADNLGAIAVYFRKIDNSSIPHIYVFDCTIQEKTQSELADIHTKIWSSGAVQLVYIIRKTSIDIFDTTKPASRDERNNLTPSYLEQNLQFIYEVDTRFKKYKSELFDTGVYWESNSSKNDNSALSILILFLEEAYKKLCGKLTLKVAQNLIVQSILIKYLEEREDLNGNRVCPQGFFSEFSNASGLSDVLRNGQYLDLCNKLNNKNSFNGGIFEWSDLNAISEVTKADLSILADLLEGEINLKNKQKYIWRQFSFTYLPIELFSRLYEQFLGFENKNAEFTPPHLAKFLVDECMPINSAENIPDPLNYKILDPSCGSGVFLVIAFKRLIQWYRIKNNYKQEIEIESLKSILKNNIYGVELKGDAVNLAIFSLSLSLCDFCNPSKLWTELHFDNLRETNLFESDFFDWIVANPTEKFDLVIGNPPFNENKKEDKEKVEKKSIKGEPKIALRFLRDSMRVLKINGLQCLIVKSSEILHNSTSKEFRYNFFKTHNVVQIIDFTCLTEVLWSVARVPTVAIFTMKSNPNSNTNILHAIIKQSQSANNKLFFELDEYDLHFVTRQEALDNPYIWKINLLGGGRIKQLVDKFSKFDNLEKYLEDKNEVFELVCEEGIGGENEAPISIPTTAMLKNGIDKSNLQFNYFNSFENKGQKKAFFPPVLIIKEDISLHKSIIQIYSSLSTEYFPFNNNFIGIKSNQISFLNEIQSYIDKNIEIIGFYLCTTSGRLLVTKNTSFVKKDLLKIPFSLPSIKLTEFEKNVISDVLMFQQNQIRLGVKSIILNKIENQRHIISFANSFSLVLNSIYEKDGKRFVLNEAKISDNYVYVSIKYTENQNTEPEIQNIDSNASISELLKGINTETLQIKRIIKVYRENEIIFIKPNQIKYWLNTIAYRDADKTFADIVNHRFFNAG